MWLTLKLGRPNSVNKFLHITKIARDKNLNLELYFYIMAIATFTKEKKIEIVCEHIRDNLHPRDVFKKYGVKQSTLYYWKQTYFAKSEDEYYEERLKADFVRIELELMGQNKNFFVRDCYVRGWGHRKLLKNIIDLHYSIMSNRPDMQGKEMTEIKKMLTDIVKFK